MCVCVRVRVRVRVRVWMCVDVCVCVVGWLLGWVGFSGMGVGVYIGIGVCARECVGVGEN